MKKKKKLSSSCLARASADDRGRDRAHRCRSTLGGSKVHVPPPDPEARPPRLSPRTLGEQMRDSRGDLRHGRSAGGARSPATPLSSRPRRAGLHFSASAAAKKSLSCQRCSPVPPYQQFLGIAWEYEGLKFSYDTFFRVEGCGLGFGV